MKAVNAVVTGESTIDIQCWFIHGSDTLGCFVVLVSDHPGVNNETMNMSRSAMLASGTFNLIQPSSCYTRIFASDIEANRRLSDLYIEGNVQPISTQNTLCTSMTIFIFKKYKIICLSSGRFTKSISYYINSTSRLFAITAIASIVSIYSKLLHLD